MQILTIPIPSGDYPLGDDCFPTSQPQHTIQLDGFEIATTTVSNQQFAEFVRAGGYQDEASWTNMGWRWQKTKQLRYPHYWQDKKFNRPTQPVVGISWYTAMAFCAWLTRETDSIWSLPSEAQWEVALRGISDVGITDEATINSADKGLGYAIAVDRGHQSTNGLYNMLGNVSEWTLSRWGRNWQTLDYAYPYDPNDGREDPSDSHARVMRGGSWFDPIQHCHPAYRARYLPGSRGSNIGFRLVKLG